MKLARIPLLSWLRKALAPQHPPEASLGNAPPAGAPDPALPELIEIEPIHACNLRCLMCHVSYEEPSRLMVDVDLVLKHLQGVRGKWVTIGSSYEPMAHPHIVKLIRGLNALDMKIDLTSNGTFFTQHVVAKIKRCNFKNVTISFDGIRPETYEAIRRGSNFRRTIDGIVRFKEALAGRDVYFCLNYTVLKQNLEEIPEAVDFWEKLGFHHIGFIIMVLRHDNDLLRQQSVAPVMDRVYDRLFEAARRIIEGKYRITLSTSADLFQKPSPLKDKYPEAFPQAAVRSRHPQARYPFNPRNSFQLGRHPGMHVDCRSPFTFARVFFSGDLQLCYQFKIGNLHEQTFEDLWYGEKADLVRAAVRRGPKVCYACDYYRFCIKAGRIDYQDQENFSNAIILAQQGKLYRIPTLIEALDGFNIVGWMGSYYGVPQELGLADLRLLDLAALSDRVLVDESLDVVRERIREAARERAPP